MHYLRELVHRLRAGVSQRAIAHDLGLARMTVQKYAQLAAAAGYLDATQPLPEAAELLMRLGPPAPPPRTPSTVEPYRAQVEQSEAAVHARLAASTVRQTIIPVSLNVTT